MSRLTKIALATLLGLGGVTYLVSQGHQKSRAEDSRKKEIEGLFKNIKPDPNIIKEGIEGLLKKDIPNYIILIAQNGGYSGIRDGEIVNNSNTKLLVQSYQIEARSDIKLPEVAINYYWKDGNVLVPKISEIEAETSRLIKTMESMVLKQK